ncbi:MAG TPA: hypothetical protein VGR60_09370 [Gemmatimonadales bacterium]|nr:hypothetical protein [Gemmatimonadales bacterium]
MAERPDPFSLVFGSMADERFAALAASLGATARDEADRDAFLLDRAVVELLQDLVPEEHDPDQIREFVAVLHHAYLFWRHGRTVVAVDRPRAAKLLTPAAHEIAPPAGVTPRPSAYHQFPERLVWAQLTPDAPHEPLDGFFLRPAPPAAIEVLGVFGVHPDRPGFGVAEVSGPRPATLRRADGSPPYSPALPGGDAAGLHSLVGADELLELAFRADGEAP